MCRLFIRQLFLFSLFPLFFPLPIEAAAGLSSRLFALFSCASFPFFSSPRSYFKLRPSIRPALSSGSSASAPLLYLARLSLLSFASFFAAFASARACRCVRLAPVAALRPLSRVRRSAFCVQRIRRSRRPRSLCRSGLLVALRSVLVAFARALSPLRRWVVAPLSSTSLIPSALTRSLFQFPACSLFSVSSLPLFASALLFLFSFPLLPIRRARQSDCVGPGGACQYSAVRLSCHFFVVPQQLQCAKLWLRVNILPSRGRSGTASDTVTIEFGLLICQPTSAIMRSATLFAGYWRPTINHGSKRLVCHGARR